MKGQFFIIGAVVITLTLFMIYDILSQEWNVDLSENQGNKIDWLGREVLNVLRGAVISGGTDTSKIKNNLDFAIYQQRKLLSGEGYELEVKYTTPISSPIKITIELKSENSYLKRSVNVSY